MDFMTKVWRECLFCFMYVRKYDHESRYIHMYVIRMYHQCMNISLNT